MYSGNLFLSSCVLNTCTYCIKFCSLKKAAHDVTRKTRFYIALIFKSESILRELFIVGVRGNFRERLETAQAKLRCSALRATKKYRERLMSEKEGPLLPPCTREGEGGNGKVSQAASRGRRGKRRRCSNACLSDKKVLHGAWRGGIKRAEIVDARSVRIVIQVPSKQRHRGRSAP